MLESTRRRWAAVRGKPEHTRGRVMTWLARGGFTARGVMYLLIGIIAGEIAFGASRRQADNTGAVRLLAQTPFGGLLLWLLTAGFAAMTLWSLAEVFWGGTGSGRRRRASRVADLGRAVFYAVVTYGILKFALGLGAPSSSDKQSQDLTAKAMQAPGGRLIVLAAGVVITGAGCWMAWQAWRKRFLRELRMGSASQRTVTIVERLGQAGGIARGTVLVTAGVFLVVAGVEANPGQAKGVDSALRALAHTALGPWLLLAVAIGLAMFAAFSWCEARWRAV